MPIRIDAQHRQARIETGAQGRAIRFRTCRAAAAIRIRAGIEQEIRLGRVCYDLGGVFLDHGKVSFRPNMHHALPKPREPGVLAFLHEPPGSLTRGHDAIIKPAIEPHAVQHTLHKPGAARRIGQKHNALAARLQRRQRFRHAGIGFAPIMHHAPKIKHIAVVTVSNASDTFQNLHHASLPTASATEVKPSRARSAARPSRICRTKTGPA